MFLLFPLEFLEVAMLLLFEVGLSLFQFTEQALNVLFFFVRKSLEVFEELAFDSIFLCKL